MPTVSVIVPNYNYARFLKMRMDSIINQTFTDYEIILLDDASSDNSRDIISQYKNLPQLSAIVFNEKNTGLPFLQWKRGIELAKGKYIWIAEADDLSKPDFLYNAVAALENNPNAVYAFTGSVAIDGDNNNIDFDYDRWDDKKHNLRLNTSHTHDGDDFVIHNQYWKCYVYNASATVFRRDAFFPADDFSECFKMRNSGDWMFWSIMAAKGDVIEIYKKLNLIRRHNSNQTETGIRNGNIFFDDLKVLKYIESNFEIGKYRKIIRHGLLYKNIKRGNIPAELKLKIFDAMHKELGITKFEYFLERIHKAFFNIIPNLLSMNNDRL